ncbi:MAG: hypothetical protein WD773_12335 [Gemmatimonadales bacterium]
MRTWAAILVLVATTAIRPAAAQWRIGLELASTNYGGSAQDTSGTGPPHAGPGDATTIGLRLDKAFSRVGMSLRASYGKAGLSFTGRGLTVTDKTSGHVLEAASLLGFQVAGIGPSGAVRAELGPALHLWKFGDEIRARVGAVGAVAYEWPVAGRFSGAIRLEGALAKSWFDAADVPPEYERRATWRYGVTLGLRYRLT